MTGQVLIVEDDAGAARVLERCLRRQGHDVIVAGNLADASAIYDTAPVSLVLLDLMLPDGHGADWLVELRRSDTKTPVIITSALLDERDQLHGFDAGAQDYITKPYQPPIVAAKVRVWINQRANIFDRPILFDPDAGCIAKGDRQEWLTPTETKLLSVLSSRPGAKLSRTDLLSVWPGPRRPKQRAVDHYVCRLRAKLDAVGGSGCIVTVHGGYVWNGDLQLFAAAQSRPSRASGRGAHTS
jgi:DNA-binding response OmpR family regulator